MDAAITYDKENTNKTYTYLYMFIFIRCIYMCI